MILIFMQNSIPDSIRSGINEASSKEFLQQLSNRFTVNKKVETSTALTKIVTMRYKENRNIKKYIMDMSNLVTKLWEPKLELFEDILFYLVLISFLAHYNTLKISYNTQKEMWSLNELIAQCVH